MQRTTPLHQVRARRSPGFTLIELMVTVSVLGVLAAIAVPGMAGLMRRWALDASADTFAGDLRLARSTATRLSRPVTVCPHGNQNGCSTLNNWETGWLVFVDLDNDSRFDADETLVVRREGQARITRMSANGNASKAISFRPNGTAESGSFRMTLVASSEAEDQREVVVNMMGRVHVDGGR